jgi:hypothetical protein
MELSMEGAQNKKVIMIDLALKRLLLFDVKPWVSKLII